MTWAGTTAWSWRPTRWKRTRARWWTVSAVTKGAPMGECRIRMPFSVGALMWSAIRNAENYGKSLGLRVELHYSGWLVRDGWLVAHSPESEMELFQRYLEAVIDSYGR